MLCWYQVYIHLYPTDTTFDNMWFIMVFKIMFYAGGGGQLIAHNSTVFRELGTEAQNNLARGSYV